MSFKFSQFFLVGLSSSFYFPIASAYFDVKIINLDYEPV